MSRTGRLRAELTAEGRAFTRRRTALFFTFVFPVLIVLAFAGAIRAGEGSFLGEEAAYFLPGYLALVFVFAPLSRVDGSVPRDRAAGRLEKLATTPLRRWEWLLARVVVTGGLGAIPATVGLAIGVAVTPATIALSPWVVPLSGALVVTFAGVGAIVGRIADSEDGAIALGNAIGFPIVFFSETLVPPSVVPGGLRPVLELSPVTHYARAVRAAFAGGQPAPEAVAVVGVVAVVSFIVGVALVPTIRR